MTEEILGADLPILPRELTELSDEVAAVPPPPIPVFAEPYAIRLSIPTSTPRRSRSG